MELFADVMRGGPLDLSRRDSHESIDADPALMLVASRDDRVFQPHLVDNGPPGRGEFRINPLYEVQDFGEVVKLRLTFPDEDYAVRVRRVPPVPCPMRSPSIAPPSPRWPPAELTPELEVFLRRRIILDLPRRYY